MINNNKTVAESKGLVWLVGLVAIGMMVNIGPLFIRINIYKTFLMFVLLTLVLGVLFVLPNSKYSIRENIIEKIPLKWMLLLSLPLLATIPGFFISGGEVNYLLNHEFSIHIFYLLWFALLWGIVKNKQSIQNFLPWVAIATIYAVVYGLFNSIDNLSTAGDRSHFSTFGHKNLFANFLTIWIPLFVILVYQYFFQRSGDSGKYIRWLYLITLLLAVTALAVMKTRAAWAGLAVSTIVLLGFVIYNRLNQYIKVKPSLFIFIAIIVPIVLLVITYFAIHYLFDENTIRASKFLRLVYWDSWTPRFLPWITAINSIQDAPIFGWGAGSSYSLFFEYIPPDSRLYAIEQSFKHVHNEWLEVLQEGGVFGLFVYGFVWIVVFITAWNTIQDKSIDQYNRSIVTGLTLGLVAYLVHSTFTVAIRMTQPEMNLFTALALILVINKNSSKKRISVFKEKFNIDLNKNLKKYFIWILLLFLIITAWLLNYKTFIGSNQMLQLTAISKQTLTAANVQNISNYYKDSESVYVQYHLAKLSLAAYDKDRAKYHLDNTDKLIKGYQDIEYYRIKEYLVGQTEKEVDPESLKKLSINHHKKDKYYLKTLHWLARIAAFEGDAQNFLRYLKAVAELKAVQHKLINSSQLNGLSLHIGMNNSIEVYYESRRIKIIIPKTQVEQWMKQSKKITLKKELESSIKMIIENIIINYSKDETSSVTTAQLRNYIIAVINITSSWAQIPK